MASAQPVFEMRGISKGFPGVREVGFSCFPGELHALVGENGAGKSTLIKILCGVYRPDAGAILLDGGEVRFQHPMEALAAGVSVIHQEFSLLSERTVAQNIFLGREPTRRGFIDAKRMNAEASRILDSLNIAHRVSATMRVRDLDVASQQMIEIAKAISLNARVVVMDEPTAALNEQECEILFSIIGRLCEQGAAVVYISHRMREIERLADRITVLKDGEVAARFDHVPASDEIVRAMVGRDVTSFYARHATPDEIGDIALSVHAGGNQRLSHISLDLRAGEIAALAGIQGAGRNALALAMFGADPFTTGSMSLAGRAVTFRSPREAILAGIALLPGDRKAEALFLMQSVRDNGMVAASAISALLGSRNVNGYVSLADMDRLLDLMNLRAAGYDQEIRLLSGGNQQKALLARWLALKPKALIFVEPTRGIDINAKASIYHLMRDLARAGTAILMVSSDLPEVIGMADRILVMRQGRIAATFGPGASEEEIMHAATGGDLLTGAVA